MGFLQKLFGTSEPQEPKATRTVASSQKGKCRQCGHETPQATIRKTHGLCIRCYNAARGIPTASTKSHDSGAHGKARPAKLDENMQARLAEMPETGFCQLCGKPNVARSIGDASVGFLCSPQCSKEHLRRVFISGTGLVLHADDKSIGVSRPPQLSAGDRAAHCWACGTAIGIEDKTCAKCGKAQALSLKED